MRKATVILTVGALALGGLAGAYALLPERVPAPAAVSSVPHPVWQEVAWPFPMDQWGKGKAFRCKATDCGTEVNVYVRAKIGFCNCTSGV